MADRMTPEQAADALAALSQELGLYDDTTLASDQAERAIALKQALILIGDRTTEEILQTAHWIAEGEIISTEGEDDDEDDD